MEFKLNNWRKESSAVGPLGKIVVDDIYLSLDQINKITNVLAAICDALPEKKQKRIGITLGYVPAK